LVRFISTFLKNMRIRSSEDDLKLLVLAGVRNEYRRL